MSVRLAPYPSYKDSGLPWLGEVPSHWDINPGLSAFREKQHKNTGMVEKTVLSLSYGSVVVKPPEKLHGLVPGSFETYQIVDPGEIVIRPTDLQNDRTSLRVGIARDRGIISSAYLCLRTMGPIIPEFGYLLLHAYDVMKVFYGMGSGLRQNLDFKDLKRMPVLIPPREEQSAIAAFLAHLDRRTSRLIRAKRRLIELLNEQKEAIIHRAVTQGPDSNVRFKPSGINWLGDVPEHWAVRRGKFIFLPIDVRTSTGAEQLLTVSSADGVVLRESKTITMFKAASYVGHKLCWPEDLVINSLWAWSRGLGFSRHHGIVSTAYGVYRLRHDFRGYWEYLDHLLRSKAYDWQFNVRSKGIWKSRLQLTDTAFLDMSIVLPPIEEARGIVRHVAQSTVELSSSIAGARREIDLLREYRARVIADVVTGKVDVRALAATLPEINTDEPLDDAVPEEGTGSKDDLDDAVEHAAMSFDE